MPQHNNSFELEAWGMKQWSEECRRWHRAAFNHNLDGVQTAVAFALPSTVNCAHFFACNNIQSGGMHNSRAVLQYLLDNGGDLHAQDSSGWLPINYAVWFGHTATLDILLELGSPVQHPHGPQPLDTALAAVAQRRDVGAESCARWLLMHNANPNMGQTADQQYGGVSWLTWALEHERWDWAELLWAKGARFLREKEIHLLLLRGGEEALAWAQFHGVDILKHLPTHHPAHEKVYQTQAHLERQKMMDALETFEDDDKEKGRRKI